MCTTGEYENTPRRIKQKVAEGRKKLEVADFAPGNWQKRRARRVKRKTKVLEDSQILIRRSALAKTVYRGTCMRQKVLDSPIERWILWSFVLRLMDFTYVYTHMHTHTRAFICTCVM